MLAQKVEFSSNSVDFSFVIANSIARKLCGGNQYTRIFVIKIGVTCKGQPWIVYRADGKVRSQFISRSLWDKAKPFLYFAYAVESYDAVALSLVATCITSEGAYSLNSRILLGQSNHCFSTVCSCSDFANHGVCVHSRFADSTYLTLVNYFDAGKLTVVDGCVVFAAPDSLSVSESKSESQLSDFTVGPKCNILWDSRRKDSFVGEDGCSYICGHLNSFDKTICEAEIAKGAPYKIVCSNKGFLFLVYSPVVSEPEPKQSDSLCEALWSSRPKLSFTTVEGSEYSGVRLSLLERPDCETEIAAGAPFKIVLDLCQFPYLVPKLTSVSKPAPAVQLVDQFPVHQFTVPSKILEAHRAAKQRMTVFNKLDSAQIYWSSDSGKWRSSTGQLVTSEYELSQVVANQLSVGYSVYVDGNLVSLEQFS